MRYLLILLLTVILSPNLFGQIIIKGNIREEVAKTPIPYVYIYAEKHQQEGVFSDINGNFTLTVDNYNDNVILSHISFKNKTLHLKNNTINKKLDILLQSNIQEIKEVLVKGNSKQNNDKIIPEILKKFRTCFSNYLSISKGYLLNLGYYNTSCISYVESIGFLYTPSKSRIEEMIFLPYNSKVSDVCYHKIENPKSIASISKSYCFKDFKYDLMLFHEKGPISNNLKLYTFSIMAINSNKMKVNFTTKAKAKFECKGTVIFDFKNNIIDKITIESLMSSNTVKQIKKRGIKPFKNISLEIGFKHFDNKIYYNSFAYNIHYNYRKTNKLSNYLYLKLLPDSPKTLESAIYKNQKTSHFYSSYTTYGHSLVRVYYDEKFWSQHNLLPKTINLSKIESDLGGKAILKQQFRKNNLVYAPLIDKLRFEFFDNRFKDKTDSHIIRTKGNKTKKVYDYLSKYILIDKTVHPFIETLNQQKELSWEK